MNTSLASFQDAFIDALYERNSTEMTTLIEQPGFLVYRNTVLKGSVDALVANFPTVERLVGTEWIKAAGTVHVRQSPPTDSRLLQYGAGFPDFLNAFEHARELPYLGDVARLDLLWTQVHCAADERRRSERTCESIPSGLGSQPTHTEGRLPLGVVPGQPCLYPLAFQSGRAGHTR